MKTLVALALVGLLSLAGPTVQARTLKQATSAPTDADILNFALNLEVSQYSSSKLELSAVFLITLGEVC